MHLSGRARLRNRIATVVAAVAVVLAAGAPAIALADPGSDAILLLWQNSGGATGLAGASTGAESCTLPDDGCSQTFEHATAYWNPHQATAHFVLANGVGAAWDASGGVTGPLGWPYYDPE